MGSRILSRSFTLDNLEDDEDEDEGPGNVSSSSAMDVDGAEAGNPATSDGPEEHESDEDEENSPNVMVPMADMLNARYETENVCAFILLRTFLIKRAIRSNCLARRIV